MLSRYQITVVDYKTGKVLKAPIECDAFAIMAFKGPMRKSRIHDRLRVWMTGVTVHEMACAMYSEDCLRKASRMSYWKGLRCDLIDKLTWRRKKA